jgi:hypothetical protein
MRRSGTALALALTGLAAMFAPTRLDAGGGPDTIWTRTYGGPHGDMGTAVFETADSGFLVIGNSFSFRIDSEDIYLIRTDRNGDTLWTRTYGEPAYKQAEAALPTNDGGYVVVGCLADMSEGGGLVFKIGAAGESLWARLYPDACVLHGICQLPDGRYMVTGTTADYPEDIWLAQLDSVGEVLWSRRYGGIGEDFGWKVLETPDGGYVIAGETPSSDTGYCDIYLVRTDSAGDTLWTRAYGGLGAEGPRQMLLTADGGYLVVGGSNTASYPDVYLVRTDSNGDTLWTRRYGGPWEDGADDVIAADGGYVVLCHRDWCSPECGDVWLMGLSDSGDTVWTRTYGGTRDDIGFGLAVVSGGGLVITGWTGSFGAGGADVYLIKTNSMGGDAIAEPKANPTRALALSLTCAPNPFTAKALIHLWLTTDSPAELAIFDAAGCRVRSLPTVNRDHSTANSVTWDGADECGHALPAGTYFAVLAAGDQHASTPIVLQK